MICNGLRKLWIADREHRELLELPGKEKEPQAAESKGRGKVPDVGQRRGGKLRAGVPEKVDQAHKNQPNGDGRQESGIALEVARKEQKERNKKVKDEHDNSDNAPLAVQARVVKGDFLRLVSRPDNQELRKLEISPEHHESQ